MLAIFTNFWWRKSITVCDGPYCQFKYREKRKRSDSVLWQKPLNQIRKAIKSNATCTTQRFQKRSIKKRLPADLGRFFLHLFLLNSVDITEFLFCFWSFYHCLLLKRRVHVLLSLMLLLIFDGNRPWSCIEWTGHFVFVLSFRCLLEF